MERIGNLLTDPDTFHGPLVAALLALKPALQNSRGFPFIEKDENDVTSPFASFIGNIRHYFNTILFLPSFQMPGSDHQTAKHVSGIGTR